MPVVWLPRAVTDLEALVAFIGADSPLSAQRVLDAVLVQVRTLSDFQALGRPGRVSGTRELVVPHVHYLVVYTVFDDAIRILRVFHPSQRWPDTL